MVTSSPLIGHTIRYTDPQWERVERAARERSAAGLLNPDTGRTHWTPSDVVRQCTGHVLGFTED